MAQRPYRHSRCSSTAEVASDEPKRRGKCAADFLAGSDSRREPLFVIGKQLPVTDAERLDPSLLPERQRNEETKLHELRNREVLVKFRP